MDIDLYAFFGISEDSSIKDIKRAYKAKARQLHPDKNKDNPKAKENFQQLKGYYELLHDPVTRKEYDRKWKAKRDSIKRHESLDSERRKLKEKLEAQEAKARAERERARQATATNAVADQLRREWQRQMEQIQLDANLARKRLNEQQRLSAHESDPKMTKSNGRLIRIKWSPSENPEVSAMYTKDFLITCLSEFGDVTTITVGKRGTAFAEFSNHSDVEAAIAASERGSVGIPTLPLKLSLVEQNGLDTPDQQAPVIKQSQRDTQSKVEAVPNTNFDSFECDILSRMANFT